MGLDQQIGKPSCERKKWFVCKFKVLELAGRCESSISGGVTCDGAPIFWYQEEKAERTRTEVDRFTDLLWEEQSQFSSDCFSLAKTPRYEREEEGKDGSGDIPSQATITSRWQ
jgi:hypothetical protein